MAGISKGSKYKLCRLKISWPNKFSRARQPENFRSTLSQAHQKAFLLRVKLNVRQNTYIVLSSLKNLIGRKRIRGVVCKGKGFLVLFHHTIILMKAYSQATINWGGGQSCFQSGGDSTHAEWLESEILQNLFRKWHSWKLSFFTLCSSYRDVHTETPSRTLFLCFNGIQKTIPHPKKAWRNSEFCPSHLPPCGLCKYCIQLMISLLGVMWRTQEGKEEYTFQARKR